MTRIGTAIVTDLNPDDITVAVADERQRASIELGAGVVAYPAESGPLDAQLRQVASIGAEIMGQAIARLEAQPDGLFPAPIDEVAICPTPEVDDPQLVAVHFPVTYVSENDCDSWEATITAPDSGCPVTITCDQDTFDDWGVPAQPGDTVHVVAVCVADFSEVARVAAFLGEMVGADGDPVVTDATDWNRPAVLPTKAAA